MVALLRLSVCLACASFLVAGQAAGAEDAELRRAIARMLDEGWKVGINARVKAEPSFRRARELAPDDHRSQYGWILVLLRHRRYEDALSRLDDLAALTHYRLKSLTWRIRIKILLKEYESALVDLESLAAALRKVDRESLQTSKFLGRVFGFLEGPARLADNILEDAETRVRDQLVGAHRHAFDEGRSAVLAQQADLLRQAADAAAETRNEKQRERAAWEQEIEAAHRQLAAELRRIETRRVELRREQQDALARLTREVRRVDSERAAAEAQLLQADRQINERRQVLADLLLAWDVEPDPGQRALLRAEIFRIEAILARLDATARRHETTLARLARSQVELEAQEVDIRNRVRRESLLLDQQESELAGHEQRLQADQRKVIRRVSDWSPRAGNLQTRAAAFTTYEALPLAREKAELLRSFD